jgi:glutathione synthase/RimK-type ligase-like ATP-grasp enzyme
MFYNFFQTGKMHMILQVLLQESVLYPLDKPIIHIPFSLKEKLNIPPGETIDIRIGNKCVTTNFFIINEAIENHETMILLNPNVSRTLSLPPTTIQVQAYYKSNELCFGPVIAILTEIKAENSEQPSFGTIHEFCCELNEYSQQLGALLYVTSLSRFPDHGYYLIEGDWKKGMVPHPDFFYNRIHSRRTERNNAFKHTVMEWQREKSILFNSHYLSKWEVHEKLEKVKHLQSYLPNTSLFDSQTLMEWLNQYRDLFIKPVHGSQGRYIIHMFYENNQIIVEQTTYSQQLSPLSVSSIEQAASVIKKRINNKLYLIQETISLITYEGCRIDFRFLCHKINHFDWKVTSAVSRLSGDNQFVSNIAQGGTVSRPLKILKTFFQKEKAALIYQLMKDLAIEISKVISAETTGLFVELGIDIGVDCAGNPWLIEVNSKPSKQIESVSNQIRPSAKAIINYCDTIWKERSQNDDNTGDINTNTT